MKPGIALATLAALAGVASSFLMSTTASAMSKAETEALYEKCSKEANAKGLFVTKGKGEERKAFRKACVQKGMGK